MFEDVIKEAMSLYDVCVDGIDDTSIIHFK